MAATVESLTVAINDQASAPADQMAAAMQGAADAADKLSGTVTTTDQTITRATRSWQSYATSGVDPAATAAKKMEANQRAAAAATQALTDDLTKGKISAEQFAIGQQNIAAALAQGNAAVDARQARTEKLRSSNDSLTKSTSAGAAVLRDLALQSQDVFAQLASGGSVFTALIQQGSQVSQQMMASGQGFSALGSAARIALGAIVSPIGLLVAGVGGITAALAVAGVAANENAARLGDLRQALRLTHDDYASLADTVEASAKRVSSSSMLTKSSAEDIGKAIASSQYLGGFSQSLDSLTKSTANYARVAGVDGVTAGKMFRQAIDDPAAAVKAFADQGLPEFNKVLASTGDTVLRTVQNLANSGQSVQATQLIFDALGRSTKGATEDLTPIGKALHELEQRFYGARDGGKSFADVVGGALDAFIAHELHGLDQLIASLEKVATGAVAAGKKVASMSVGGGIVGADGMPVDVVGTPRSPATASGSLSQVDSTIQALLLDSAKQYQVDTELLARLQLVENRTPSGRDAAGNAIYPSSPTGAIGAMQVTGSTFRGMPEFAGQNVNDNATNIDAGTSLFAHLLKKYGDPYMAVLAYHDGETLIDKVLSGALDSSGNSYQASIEGKQEALKVTAGYTGRGYLGVTGASPSPNDVGSFIPGKSSASLVLPDSVQKSLGTGSDGTQFANAQDAAASVEKYTRAIIDMHAAGQDTGPVMDRLQALLSKAREAAYGAVSPFESLTRASQDQFGPLQAQSGAARTVAEAVNQATIALKSHGEDITSAQADQVRTDALTKLGLAFNDNVAGIDRQIDAQNRINAVYAQSGGNLAEITAKTQAEASARETAIPGTAEYARQVAVLTEKNLGLANSQKDLAQIQQNRGVSDNIAYIQKETDTLGLNEDARTRVLAVMKAEQDQHAKYGPILDAEQQHYIDLIGKQADYTASLKNQQASLSELTGFVDSTFSTISDSIVSAFATGEQSAVKFQDVVGSVVKAIEAEFIKLALVNPLKDLLLGSTSPSLSSVGGVLGKLLGNEVTGVTGSAGATGAASLASAFDAPLSAAGSATDAGFDGAGTVLKGAGLAGSLSTGSGLLSDVFGTGAGGTLIEQFGDKLVSAVTGAFGNAAETTSIIGAAGDVGASATIAASVSNALGFSNETAAAISAATGTIADAIPYIGAAISVVTSIANGDYRGAAITASTALAGAYIGSLIGSPGVGTAVGAAVGALISAFLPNHPLHPYSNVDLNIQGGQLTTEGGYDVGQLTDLNADKAGVQAYADSINTYLQKVGVVITDADGTLGHVGAGITGFSRAGLTTDQTADVTTLFKNLSFGGDPNDRSNFGIAKGALQGMSFNSPVDLQNELYKIAGFADAVDALGISLKSVGKDISNIQIASVSGGDANATSTVTDANGLAVNYHADLRTALNADLPTKSYADVTALDAEMQKVSDFVTGTIPSLLTPVRTTQSTLQDQIVALNHQYADAMTQSKSYGLDNDAPLLDAENRAIAILMKPALDALGTALTSIAGRAQTALYGQAGTAQATMANLAQTQNNERSSLYDQIHQTFGDNQVATDAYNQALQQLLVTQNAETQATQQQIAITQASTANTILSNALGYQQRDNIAVSGANAESTALAQYDVKASQERIDFVKSWTDAYGQQITASADFQNQLALVDKTHYDERLALQQTYQDQSTAAMKTAQGSVVSLFGSIKDYALKLQTGSQSTLSPLSQYDLTKSQFSAVSGAALAGDANSASQLTTYADALLTASQAVNGSGAAYAADFSQVLDVLQGISGATDALTQSFMQQQTNDVVSAVTAVQTAVTSVQTEVAALRREMQQQTRAMA